MFLERHVQNSVKAFSLRLMNGVDPQRRRIAVSQVLDACERHVRQRLLGQLAPNVVGHLQAEIRLHPGEQELDARQEQRVPLRVGDQ